jgi:hypothetical protein
MRPRQIRLTTGSYYYHSTTVQESDKKMVCDRKFFSKRILTNTGGSPRAAFRVIPTGCHFIFNSGQNIRDPELTLERENPSQGRALAGYGIKINSLHRPI